MEEYSMERIKQVLKYDREMLIVLALLLGCDYDSKGIAGIGKENACKFLNEIVEYNEASGEEEKINPLDLIRKWSKNDYIGLKYEDRIRKLVFANKGDAPFPNEKIIQEYLTFDKVTQVILSDPKYLIIDWKRPNLQSLQVFIRQFIVLIILL
jgi:5'-3' exonuclease